MTSYSNALNEGNITSCSFVFNNISDENILYRLNENTASLGFIYRHIGERMLMFGYFFGMTAEVSNTTMGSSVEGQGSNLEGSQ